MSRLEQLQHAKQDARDSAQTAQALYYSLRKQTAEALRTWDLAERAFAEARDAFSVESAKESEAVARIGEDMRGITSWVYTTHYSE